MSVADGTSVIPPGWYPDPADDARLRRWDGQQWTQEVLLAPEQAPAAATVPTAPPVAPQAYVPPQPVVQEPQSAPLQYAPQPTVSDQPPLGRPVPASPAPSVAPPGAPVSTPAPAESAAPAAAPAPAPTSAPPVPTIPRPSPPISQPSHAPSGPVSPADWGNLPGLTLPPDLSSLPGTESSSILQSPTFAVPEPEPQRGLPTLPVFEPPYIPQRPDVQSVGRTQKAPPKERIDTPQPAASYAPPPVGAQYDVPPPPGMAHVPTSGPVLPPSAFVAPQMQATSWPLLPPVGSPPMAAGHPSAAPIVSAPTGLPPVGSIPAAPNNFGSRQRTVPDRSFESAVGTGTVSSWLIAALPLVQFAAIYVVFGTLGVTFAPGMQWGILAAPAAFSLLFANADRKRLADLGSPSPSIVFAFVPPLYLLVRCFTAGRSSLVPLVGWLVLQAGAAAGVYYLLPTVLAAAQLAMA